MKNRSIFIFLGFTDFRFNHVDNDPRHVSKQMRPKKIIHQIPSPNFHLHWPSDGNASPRIRNDVVEPFLGAFEVFSKRSSVDVDGRKREPMYVVHCTLYLVGGNTMKITNSILQRTL